MAITVNPVQNTVVTAGVDLFRIAMMTLGDATQFVRLLDANGLTDPMAPGLLTLIIPPVDPSQTGGLPNT